MKISKKLPEICAICRTYEALSKTTNTDSEAQENTIGEGRFLQKSREFWESVARSSPVDVRAFIAMKTRQGKPKKNENIPYLVVIYSRRDYRGNNATRHSLCGIFGTGGLK